MEESGGGVYGAGSEGYGQYYGGKQADHSESILSELIEQGEMVVVVQWLGALVEAWW